MDSFSEIEDDEENASKATSEGDPPQKSLTHSHQHSHSRPTSLNISNSHPHSRPPSQDCDGKLCKDFAAVGQDVVVVSAAVKFHQKDVANKMPALASCKHAHSAVSVNLLADSRGVVVLVKAYLMEIAIATHSIIIGISMGMMGPDEVSTLRALLGAMVFHQFFEGVGLGAVMSYLRVKLGSAKVAVFALVFGTTLSIGIGIGMLIATLESSEQADAHVFTTSCCNAIAAGTLVYVSLVEMLAEEFSSSELEARHAQKLGMVVAFALGVLVMAILAIWA